MDRILRLTVIGIAIAGWAWVPLAVANEPAPRFAKPWFKISLDQRTVNRAIGGRHLWGDVYHFCDYRIQQNVVSKSYRLIDVDESLQHSGTFEECQTAIQQIRDEQNLVPPSGPAVILIHGLLQTSRCMKEMANSLRSNGFSTICFDYPSSQLNIPESAELLNRFIQSLDGYSEINFVVHSMGGLVVRAYVDGHDDPRVKRMVMLGTPNQGAELADITQRYWFFQAATGPGARQLRTEPDGLVSQLPVPRFPFAVIAGSRGTATGWNPLIPGDDDGTVTVASTYLDGAADFTTVNSIHSRLLSNERAILQTVSFLKNGQFMPDAAEDEESPPVTVDRISTATK